jgi:hypothetical protein
MAREQRHTEETRGERPELRLPEVDLGGLEDLEETASG